MYWGEFCGHCRYNFPAKIVAVGGVVVVVAPCSPKYNVCIRMSGGKLNFVCLYGWCSCFLYELTPRQNSVQITFTAVPPNAHSQHKLEMENINFCVVQFKFHFNNNGCGGNLRRLLKENVFIILTYSLWSHNVCVLYMHQSHRRNKLYTYICGKIRFTYDIMRCCSLP